MRHNELRDLEAELLSIEPTPLLCQVDEFFATVSGWFSDMYMIPLELKTHFLFRIYPTSSQMPQNPN